MRLCDDPIGKGFVLDRPRAGRRQRKILGPGADILRALVDKGLRQLDAWIEDGHQTTMSIAAISLQHAMLESLDAVDILLQAGAVGPAVGNARSVLETIATVLYLIDQNDERVAAAYLRSRDEHVALNLRTLPVDDLSETETCELKELLNELDSPDERAMSWAHREAYRAWVAAKAEKAPALPTWWSLFGGPNTVAGLLNRARIGHFIPLYREWSAQTHGRFGMAQLNENGRLDSFDLRPLRHYDPRDARDILEPLSTVVMAGMSVTSAYFDQDGGLQFHSWLEAHVVPRIFDFIDAETTFDLSVEITRGGVPSGALRIAR